MSADKALTSNTTAIYLSRSFGYEKINKPARKPSGGRASS
jgi:hypothetical protein